MRNRRASAIRIACLHTAASNVAVFEAARRGLGLVAGTLRHEVRPDLLDDAERAGGLTPEIEARACQALLGVCHGADAVLLTCSTLGPAAWAAAGTAPVPVLRVDAALAERAVRGGGKVVALCAVETTLGPTRALFEAAAIARRSVPERDGTAQIVHRRGATRVEVEVRLIPGAWAAFKAGDHDRYLAAVAQAADEAARGGASCVALAQASMAGAAGLVTVRPPPLAGPAAGLRAAVTAAKRAAGRRADVRPGVVRTPGP